MKKGADIQADRSHGSERRAAGHTQIRGEDPAGVSCVSPDVLIAVDVDPMELVLQMLIFNIAHVVDHFQDNKPGEHRQHEPLLEQSKEEGQSCRLARESQVGGHTEVMGLLAKLLEELLVSCHS